MRCPKCGRQTRPRLRGEAKDVGERAGHTVAAELLPITAEPRLFLIEVP